MGSDASRPAVEMLAEMDKTISDTAARIEHCRALVREADRLLDRMRLKPAVDEANPDELEANSHR